MQRANALTDPLESDPADPAGYRSSARRLGGGDLAVKAFEVPPGEALCPYHYEYVDEWLIVLGGRPTVRTPEGEAELEPGDVVRFPSGPDGAHKVINRGTEAARLVMFSSAHEPSVAVYPDSDKIGVWTPDRRDKVMLRRRDGQVPYYEGEA